jgi:hypothetical protein
MKVTAKERPVVQLTGQDGNIYSIVARAGRALRRAGFSELEKEIRAKLRECKSYDDAIQMVMDYVEVR